ncbi:uncharacterized protein UV8b_05995 [Ustilaginoidea virens]|uniref:GABA permease n=1 Tax=Ustilaginoidea virens TaxID=1159556 RepID=A0A8E5MJ63_USTVR|nr:uncharacterized protein UV8b_05995 [Ustilaginoidea virens]QUC21752.1 hypothetical protein UV8b_05995 [Ustilaginoidea virens]
MSFSGGPGGLLYQYIFVWIGTLCTAPTAGGQYHWVSMLAPKPCRNFLSYITGWLTILSWIATIGAGAFLAGSMIQGLCLVNWSGFALVIKPFHGTLIAWAVIMVAVLFNTVVAGLLPRVEGAFLILHVLGFFGILIPLLYYSPKGSGSDVFSTFMNEGGWPTYGISFMVGTGGLAFAFAGADAAVHMCEEITNAAINVPRAIASSVVVNGSLGLGMLVAVLFCMGDAQAALEAADTIIFPFIYIFIQGTGSVVGSSVMTSILIALAVSGTVGFIATASRMIWSFARDRGLPFSRMLSQYRCKVHRRSSVPVWAIAVASIVPCLLILINIGSNTVFNGVTSLTLVSLYSTYFISLALLLHRRLGSTIKLPCPGALPEPACLEKQTGEYELTWGPWHVPGWVGTANNAVSLAYMLVVWVFGFFPAVRVVDAPHMNYSSVVFGAVVMYSTLYYYVWGRRQYKGPVIEISP